MANVPCDIEKVYGQTLFLGATVLSFNVNVGWGGQSSTLTVELMEDKSCVDASGNLVSVFNAGSYANNHYYSCSGNDCYIDEQGLAYNPDRTPNPSKDKVIPGKIYYVWGSTGLESKYWIDEDPGFFATGTKIDTNGNYFPNLSSSQLYGYDIIGVPVCFKMDNFTFTGIVQSWEKNIRPGQITYTVHIESMDRLLDNSYIIISEYGGCIFSKSSSATYGAPRNYIGGSITYHGTLNQGNIPNVFNVYGFLESMGMNSFGGAKVNDNGIIGADVIDALQVLTSCKRQSGDDAKELDNKNKKAFSPFGRILSKTMQDRISYTSIANSFKNMAFGVIAPETDVDNILRTSFVLDISEIRRPPKDYRISGNNGVLSINDFLRTITTDGGQDYYTTTIPVIYSNERYNVIKVKTIDRTIQVGTNQIENTIAQFVSTYGDSKITSSSIGKEANQSVPRIMYIGAKQQRLYQAKNYRLAYSQSSYVYHPSLKKFIDFNRLNQQGKVRMPSAFSTRNPALSTLVNGSALTSLWNTDEDIKVAITNKRFTDNDSSWIDTEAGANSGTESILVGNYGPATLFTTSGSYGRFVPLYQDIICPFFGYQLEEQISIDTNGGSNNFRKIRPVWFDNWTGQINVIFQNAEIPKLSVGPVMSLYTPPNPNSTTGGVGTGLGGGGIGGGNAPTPQPTPAPTATPSSGSSGSNTLVNPASSINAKKLTVGFVITETEFRAAMSGFDSYFAYCLGKSSSTKPDLFAMLINAYAEKGIFPATTSNGSTTATNYIGTGLDSGAIASNINSADPIGLPTQASPGQQTKMNVNWNVMFDMNFIKDMQIITNFIAKIGNANYGKKYMVRLPEVASYKDSQYSSIQLPVLSDNISVFSGSGKIFYSFEPCGEAWEEPGNFIDDTILVGSPNYYVLANDRGMIQPVLGYNNSDNYDYVRRSLCRAEVAANIAGNYDNVSNYILSKYAIADAFNRTSRSPYFNLDETAKQKIDKILEALQNNGCNASDFMTYGLQLSSLDPSQYVIVNNKSARKDAFDTLLPLSSSAKLYTVANVGEMAFLDPLNMREPRVIVDSPGIPVGTSSLRYRSDPNETVISNIAIEDLSIFLKVKNGASLTADEQSFVGYMEQYITPGQSSDGIANNYLITKENTNNQSARHAKLHAKMAHPFFAGIPVKSNQYNYGPWTNYPALTSSDIYPELTGTSLTSAIENLIGGVKVESKDDLNPWDFGGMSFLDKAVMYEIQSNANYQQILESASISMIGLPIFGVGGQFALPTTSTLTTTQVLNNNEIYNVTTNQIQYYDHKLTAIGNQITQSALNSYASTLPDYIGSNSFNNVLLSYNVLRLNATNTSSLAPIVSNIQVSIDTNGATTSYQFKTFSRKMGLYSKENVDRMKQSAKNNISFNKQIFKSRNKLARSSEGDIRSIIEDVKNRDTKLSGESFRSELFGNSPTELLIGSAGMHLEAPNMRKNKQLLDNLNLKPTANSVSSASSSSIAKYGLDLGDGAAQYTDYTNHPYSGSMNQSRHNSWVGMFKASELRSELLEDYNNKASMSLDGIFSPISFFPTVKNSTYPLSYYDHDPSGTTKCPQCKSTGKITSLVVDYNNNNAASTQTYACPSCSRGKFVVGSGTDTGSSSTKAGETLPPYIISSGTDISLLKQLEIGGSISSSSSSSSSSTGSAATGIKINMVSLQPIVVPYGRFKNPNVQNSGNVVDRCRHSIQVVGRGDYPQSNSMSFLIRTNLKTYVDPSTGQVTNTDGQGVNPDYYELDIFKQAFEGGTDKFALNQRFFGLRGPLVLHAWGYDSQGYPVPNAADEPKEMDSYGRPKRFILKDDGTNDLEADGYFLPPDGKYLGDIIGQGYTRTGNKWTKKKSDKFYLNWAERPDLWPVGPIDLRWDESRRVWSINPGVTTYKLVYVTLEEDLVKEDNYDETYPARGFLDDLEYSSEPLPNGFRRLVYVKDKGGYTAPRGCKLLCRYDTSSGFYEPVSKSTFVCKGTIDQGGNKAVLELAYIQGKKAGEMPTMLVDFDNSFNLSVSQGKKGLFTFMGGKWVLTTVEP